MTKTERIALVYGLSVGGAALVSYCRGRRGLAEVGMDAALHGVMLGTGANVVLYMRDSAVEKQLLAVAVAPRALPNRGQEECNNFGKVAAKGIDLLSQINPAVLYKAAKLGGVSIGLAPEDPHDVALPPE